MLEKGEERLCEELDIIKIIKDIRIIHPSKQEKDFINLSSKNILDNLSKNISTRIQKASKPSPKNTQETEFQTLDTLKAPNLLIKKEYFYHEDLEN